MLEAGSGFFAMWCGIAPEWAGAFGLMHSRDHLAEHMAYLGPDGIRWARRFADGHGTLPPNFVFYHLSSLDLLVDPALAGATVHETEWFKAVRPHYRDRIAHHCRVLGSAGGGCGGSVATLLVDLGAASDDRAAVAGSLDALTRISVVTAAHLGRVDWQVPIRIGQALPQKPTGDDDLGILVVESFDRLRLAPILDRVVDQMRQDGMITRVRGVAHYGLSYALDQSGIGDLKHFRRDDELVGAMRAHREG